MRTIVRIILAAAGVLAVAGCSLATMAYNNAPSMTLYALNDYFDLSAEQEAWLKPRLNGFIAWHRANELPIYRGLLNEASRQVESGVHNEEVRAFYVNGRMRLERAADHALPDITAFLAQLTPQQIARMESRMAADNRKMEEEARVPAVERQQQRVKKSLLRFEDWFGPLSMTQAAKIRAVLSTMPPLDEMRIADRKRRQTEFIALLKAAPDAQTMQTALRWMLLQPERGRDAVFQAELDRQLDSTLTLVKSLLVDAAPAQRARVQKRLNGYAGDIDSLLRSS